MKYYKVQLSNTYIDTIKQEQDIDGALNEIAYLELNDEGTVNIRFCDADGNTIEIPEIQESRVIDLNPERLEWMA